MWNPNVGVGNWKSLGVGRWQLAVDAPIAAPAEVRLPMRGGNTKGTRRHPRENPNLSFAQRPRTFQKTAVPTAQALDSDLRSNPPAPSSYHTPGKHVRRTSKDPEPDSHRRLCHRCRPYTGQPHYSWDRPPGPAEAGHYVWLLSLFERDEALWIRGAGVVRARAEQAVVGVLLEDVGGPA